MYDRIIQNLPRPHRREPHLRLHLHLLQNGFKMICFWDEPMFIIIFNKTCIFEGHIIVLWNGFSTRQAR